MNLARRLAEKMTEISRKVYHVYTYPAEKNEIIVRNADSFRVFRVIWDVFHIDILTLVR